VKCYETVLNFAEIMVCSTQMTKFFFLRNKGRKCRFSELQKWWSSFENSSQYLAFSLIKPQLNPTYLMRKKNLCSVVVFCDYFSIDWWFHWKKLDSNEPWLHLSIRIFSVILGNFESNYSSPVQLSHSVMWQPFC